MAIVVSGTELPRYASAGWNSRRTGIAGGIAGVYVVLHGVVSEYSVEPVAVDGIVPG